LIGDEKKYHCFDSKVKLKLTIEEAKNWHANHVVEKFISS